MKIIKPKKLNIGDTIGIIAPSYEMKPEYLEKPVQTLKDMGFNVKFSDNLFSSTNNYAGSVKERADDFNNMICDKSVKMILFGGGEVCNEILPYIDYNRIIDNPKIICSYSDGTSILNAVHSKTGLITFNGASPRTFENANEYNSHSFKSRLMHCNCTYNKSSEYKVIKHGNCKGILTGGYLVNFASLFATPYFYLKKDKKYVLFIEDHERFSSPAVVSKWFSNLEMYGAFENVVGLIFGHYSEKEYPVIDDILGRIGKKYSIPVIRCDDFGHGVYNSIYPIGISCKIDTATNTLEFVESGVV